MDISATIPFALADDIRELLQSIGESSFDVGDSLASLRRDLKLSVRSSLGFSLHLSGSQPVTLTCLDFLVRPEDIATSLAFPLSWVDPPGTESSIVFYAGVPGALVDLSADIAYALHLPLDGLRLDQDLAPERLESGVDGLDEASAIDRAIGTLIGDGHTPETAEAELARQAEADSQSLYASASRLLAATAKGKGRCVPGHR